MLHITTHKKKSTENNKMDGMISINTNSLTNAFCLRMRLEDTICKSCYTKRMEKVSKQMVSAFQRNTEELTSPDFQAPIINASTVRFNSFGELVNTQHYKNLLKICKANPSTSFTLWTKRPDMVQTVGKKPANLILIYSCHVKNQIEDIPAMFDKTFTVYTTKYIRDNGKKINCGKKNCFSCRICYSKNDISEVSELIK
jgi:hypothetical protein